MNKHSCSCVIIVPPSIMRALMLSHACYLLPRGPVSSMLELVTEKANFIASVLSCCILPRLTLQFLFRVVRVPL